MHILHAIRLLSCKRGYVERGMGRSYEEGGIIRRKGGRLDHTEATGTEVCIIGHQRMVPDSVTSIPIPIWKVM